MKSSRLDIATVTILPVLAGLATFFLRTNLFTSVILFFGLPSAYLAVRNPGIFKKSFIFAFLVSMPSSLFVDALAAVNGSWVVPQSIFPFRFFGAATVEVYVFGLLWILFAVLFYEHFFDGGRRGDKLSPHIIYLVYICVALVLYSVVAFFFDERLLYIPYFYLLCGIVLVIIPLVIFLFRYPIFIPRYLVLGAYFFFVLFIFEITAVSIGQWIFPAKDFIGFVDVLGTHLPIEELVIWMSAATTALMSYYEFFADDKLL